MKKIINFVIVILGLLTLNSCEKQPKLNRDNDGNVYLINNQTINQNISRDSLVQFDLYDQLEIINLLTPDNKRRIYTEKLDILKTEVNFTTSEIEAINMLYTFDLSNQSIEDSISLWRQYVQSTFNWSDSVIFVYFENYYTLSEYLSGFYWSKIDGVEVGSGSKPQCVCMYSLGCGLISGYCNKTRDICEIVNRNCGILGHSWCIGVCE